MQIGANGPPGKDMKRSLWGSGGQKWRQNDKISQELLDGF